MNFLIRIGSDWFLWIYSRSACTNNKLCVFSLSGGQCLKSRYNIPVDEEKIPRVLQFTGTVVLRPPQHIHLPTTSITSRRPGLCLSLLHICILLYIYRNLLITFILQDNETADLKIVSVLPVEPPKEWRPEVSHCYRYLVTAQSSVVFLTHRYRFAFCLDMSPSVSAVVRIIDPRFEQITIFSVSL